MRIQFDISEEEAERLKPFILNEKSRHLFGHIALTEWVKRKEGNLKRKKQ